MTTRTKNFYEALVRYSPMKAVRTPDVPQDMVVKEDDSPGWIEWRLLACGRDFSDEFASLEGELGFAYPPSFKDWYTAYYTLGLDLSIVRLPENRPGRSIKDLRERVLSDWARRPLQLGLAAFGDEANDCGPLCLDMRHSADSERWPVTFWDHGWQHTDKEIGPPIFSCFQKLLECCTVFMNACAQQPGEESVRHGIDAMQALDPDGAGGAGVEYWEFWKGAL